MKRRTGGRPGPTRRAWWQLNHGRRCAEDVPSPPVEAIMVQKLLFISILAVSSISALLSGHAQDTSVQERAIAEIEKQGGKVRRNEAQPGKPVVAINLDRAKEGDGCLKQIRGWKTI